MINPFEAFKEYKYSKRALPLDDIVASKAMVVNKLMEGYQHLLDEEVKELVWLARENTIMRAYALAEEWTRGIDYDVEDIEEFCFELDRIRKAPYKIAGPGGLYLSALCNNVKENELVLRIGDMEGRIHLLGYRLPKGKRLIVEGDLGDFAGIGLEGGELIVRGKVGNATGAGMKAGRILVEGDAGHRTGEWMMGGEIRVEGTIASIGQVGFGRIFERGRQVYPPITRPRRI
ncbi:MAG TPA: hypothetical protein EYP61_01665 [Candidatus Latescibacteria bacterium]|nr:hypothetical protein [Candidatus Latescibacterota bacterium]